MTAARPLSRTQHRNLVTGSDLPGATVHRESRVDLGDYLDPAAAVRAAALHGPGVADGLRVSATAGVAGLQVETGVAVDRAGRAIVLADGGVAVTARDADATSARNLATVPVGSAGVAVDTTGLTGELLLTAGWAEAEASGGQLLRHAPWLQLLAADDPNIAPGAVALARVVLDADGAVTELTGGPRVPVAAPAGRLELRAVRETGPRALAVEQVSGAELRTRADGSLDVALGVGAAPALSVLAPAGTVAVAGALTAGSTVAIAGALTAASTVTVAGALTAASIVTIGGALTAASTVTIGGALTATSTVAIAGGLSVGDAVAARALALTEAATVGGPLSVAGAVTAGSTLTAQTLAVTDGATLGGPLSVAGPVEIGDGAARLTSGPGGEGGALDVPARMRVRQGRDASSGIWLHQNGPEADRAFVGMADDTHVGFWGNTGAAWALTVDTTSGFVEFKNDFGRPGGPSTLSLFGSRIADVGDFVLSLRSGGGVVAFDGGDNVGIGTRTPRDTLEVAGTILTRAMVVGGDTRGELVVHGGIQWDDEHADQNYLRLGRVQMCWGEVALAQRSGETQSRVDFPAPFAGAPVVTASVDDPGYGTSGLQAAAGAYRVDVGGFTVLYKSNSGRPGTVYCSWFAVGRWA